MKQVDTAICVLCFSLDCFLLFKTSIFPLFKNARLSLTSDSLWMRLRHIGTYSHVNENMPIPAQKHRHKQLFVALRIPCCIWMDPNICLRSSRSSQHLRLVLGFCVHSQNNLRSCCLKRHQLLLLEFKPHVCFFGFCFASVVSLLVWLLFEI